MINFLNNFSMLRGDTGRLFALNSLTGLSYSLIMPIMSIFLIQKLGAPPSYIGIYTIATALSGVCFSQLMGHLLDRGKNGRYLFLASMSAALLAGISFANANSFWAALMTGVVLMGFASASFPLMLAMIRSYADQSGGNSLALNSQMRAGISLVWIVGPTLAFSTIDWLGFEANFYLASALCLVVVLMAWLALPNVQSPTKPTELPDEQQKIPLILWALGAVMLLGNFANTIYLTAMPLYVTQELGLGLSLPGMLMGLTAGLEIPFMLLVPRWASRFGSRRMLIAGFICAFAFYGLLQYADSKMELLALQLLNGIYFGIFAGLGISVIQDAAAKRMGFASAFYTNAMRVGMMAGTASAGVLADLWSFKIALVGSIVTTLIALVVMLLIHFVETPAEQSSQQSESTSSN